MTLIEAIKSGKRIKQKDCLCWRGPYSSSIDATKKVNQALFTVNEILDDWEVCKEPVTRKEIESFIPTITYTNSNLVSADEYKKLVNILLDIVDRGYSE